MKSTTSKSLDCRHHQPRERTEKELVLFINQMLQSLSLQTISAAAKFEIGRSIAVKNEFSKSNCCAFFVSARLPATNKNEEVRAMKQMRVRDHQRGNFRTFFARISSKEVREVELSNRFRYYLLKKFQWEHFSRKSRA